MDELDDILKILDEVASPSLASLAFLLSPPPPSSSSSS